MEREPGAADTEEFMSVAAHDLRNPIAVVRASAQMAQRQINRGDTSGAQARLRSIVAEQGGFSRFRRATQSPFNLVLEARP